MVKPSIPSTAKEFPKTLKQFAASLEAEEAAPLTVKNYLLDLAHFARWFSGTNGEPLTLPAITPTDIREYKSYLLTSAQAKPATVNRRLASLRKLCRFARRQGLLVDDPTQEVKSVERVKQAPKALDKKELNALMRAVERYGSVRDQAIIQVLRHSGIRVGELANLKRADLELSERKGMLTIRSGKGNKWRELPMNTDLRRALKRYLAERPAVKDERVFIGQRETGMTVSGLQDVVEKYARLARLDGVSAHTLRHTFGKSLLDSGTDLVAVANLLGHSRLDTTAIYTQPTPQDLARAVERISVSEA
jgi:site-specific recombinase XerD